MLHHGAVAIPRRAIVEAVNDTGRPQWERVLLVLATLLGVVAMHATIAPMHDQAGPMPGSATFAGNSVAHDLVALIPVGGSSNAEVTTSSSMPGDGPMSMPHLLMHLCLAIMTMVILLGLLTMVLTTLLRCPRSPARLAYPASSRPLRPPHRHAVRLAQLCVLRN